MSKPLTVTVPSGAECKLYAGVPERLKYPFVPDPEKVVPATDIAESRDSTRYLYTDLRAGLYYYAVSQEGCYSVYQVLNYTEEMLASGLDLDIRPDRKAGGGYEADYILLNTREFIEKQLISHKDAWGPEYAKLFRTPQFLRAPGQPGGHRQTTNEEMMDFIAKLDAACPYMHVFSLGKSPKYGYDIPLVLFTKETVTGRSLPEIAALFHKTHKPIIQYTAQCHSLEPAGCEGALAMMLRLCEDYGQQVLDHVNIYIIPRINPDGAYEVTRTSPTTNEDMNRDYLRANNAEIRMVIGAYNLFLPEIAIDGHEKKHYPLEENANLCTDMELQTGAGSLNHPANMTQKTMEIARKGLEKAAALGLRGHFYSKLASAAGGAAGSSYFGNRNSLSFLVETPGQVHLGMAFLERRVLAHYVFVSTVIDYAAEHASELWASVQASRSFMAKKGAIWLEEDDMVLEHDKKETGTWASPFIHVPTGEVVEQAHAVPYTEHVVALHSRPRATAYVLPLGLANEEEILRLAEIHAIGYYPVPAGSKISLRQYRKQDDGICVTEEQTVCFAQGAWVFPNTVPSTILNLIMEPDFNAASGRKMTLFSMGLIEADAEGKLPLYRYCHTLAEDTGTVTLAE